MPHIQSIRLEYGDEIRVLAVHFRDDKGDPIAFIENAGYDLYTLPKLDLSAAEKSATHGKKAAYLAPYWAAELRKSLDLVLGAQPIP